jgi:YD repeat-containing protein
LGLLCTAPKSRRQIASATRSNNCYSWTRHYDFNLPYATNGLNQYTAAGGGAFTYDIENRLVTASGATTAGLRYDPLGRLYETTGASGSTRFLYDGDELVAEFNGSGTPLRRYVHGTSADDPVIWYEGSAIAPARWPYRRISKGCMCGRKRQHCCRSGAQIDPSKATVRSFAATHRLGQFAKFGLLKMRPLFFCGTRCLSINQSSSGQVPTVVIPIPGQRDRLRGERW